MPRGAESWIHLDLRRSSTGAGPSPGWGIDATGVRSIFSLMSNRLHELGRVELDVDVAEFAFSGIAIEKVTEGLLRIAGVEACRRSNLACLRTDRFTVDADLGDDVA